jgi:quercetin dioxygenase-like cupin family protein
MALTHAISGESIDVKPFGPRLQGERTFALFKSEQLEVMRLVLQAGQSVPPHKVPGEITIQCIEGRIAVSAHGRSQVLQTGQLLFLQGGVVHELSALEDASALLTIVLKQ